MKLTPDILPRALWNFCEEIFRIKNTRFILLKTLKFSYGLCHKNGKNYKTHALPDFESHLIFKIVKLCPIFCAPRLYIAPLFERSLETPPGD